MSEDFSRSHGKGVESFHSRVLLWHNNSIYSVMESLGNKILALRRDGAMVGTQVASLCWKRQENKILPQRKYSEGNTAWSVVP